jgi:hypothetical protein
MEIIMKKLRINTSLRNKLSYYVRSQIEEAMDKTSLNDARRRLEAEALRLVQAAYPPHDMAILAQYGKTDRYRRFSFAMPDGEAEAFEFAEPLPYDLPDRGSYRFEQPVQADEAFTAVAQDAARAEAVLKAEAARQWKQAEVLVNCALYFEDVLDYLSIPDAERVSLSHRWHLSVAMAEPEPDISEETGSEAQSPVLRLIEAVEPAIAYAESEALALEGHKDSPEAEAEAERAWQIVDHARAAILAFKAA